MSTELSQALQAASVETFRASDDYEWHYRHWSSGPEPRVIVVALHGIQSHSGWYGWSSSQLAQRGIDVYFLDRRGSGLNRHQPGHAAHPDRLINDVVQFTRHLQARWRGEPAARPAFVLLGLSWGGRLAAATAARFPDLFDGLVLLYPGIFAQIQPTRWQRFLLKLATDMDRISDLVDIPLDDPRMFTSAPPWQRFIADDPLALHQASVGFLAAGVTLSQQAAAQGPRISSPTLMMLADRDRIIDNTATRQYFLTLGCSHRTLVTYPDAEHTLEFEECREAFVEDLARWLLSVPQPR